MGTVLGIVYRVIATYLTNKPGYTKASARAGNSYLTAEGRNWAMN